MKNIFNKQLMLPVALGIIGGLLISFRIMFTGELRFIFLIWNLILAFVPYVIAKLMIDFKDKSYKFWGLFLCWLLFFPNAPYILTDFYHLKFSSSQNFTMDFLIISYFSLVGIFYGTLSIHDLLKQLQTKMSPAGSWGIILIAIFLSGIGIYLGRFIRWNSWDVLHAPHLILNDIWSMIINPSAHLFAWKFSLGISLYIFVSVMIHQIIVFYVQKKRAFFNQ